MSSQTEASAVRPETNGAGEPEPFPLLSYAEASRHLRRPFTTEAIRFKPQSRLKSGNTLCVAHIDARLVIERLNLVCPDAWFAEYEPTAQGLMWCHLTVCGITRRDVGEGKGKALVSDSLKRAAVHFGVGVSLYAVPAMVLQGEVKYLLERHAAELRGRYGLWLEETGIQKFGFPLDHGDVEDSQGAVEEEADAPVAQLPVEGPEADALRGQITALYTELREKHRGVVKPAEFVKWTQDAELSLEGLGDLHARLTAKLAEARNVSPQQEKN